MKLNNNANTLTTNNTENKSVDFGIGDPAMVIRILRKHLYGNPIQTLVQEYISNARDACREAGLQQKITVTLPTDNNKVFKVRDYGNGINPERMNTVFIKFASSTKRSDNVQTGGFGIGAKSAWAYTDNFTIVSYVDGIARHYVAHIAKNDTGTLDLINEVQTNEPNGTEIAIAVAQRDMQAFNAAVFRCTYFWDVKPDLRGIGPSEVPDWYKTPECIESILNVKFFKKDSLKELCYDNMLVIDGIPYPLSYQFFEAYHQFPFSKTSLKYAVFIDNGIIEVSANREVITDNDNTKEKLKTIFTNLADSIEKHVKNSLAKTNTLAEFLAEYKKYNEIFDVGTQTYKDLYVQDTILTNNNKTGHDIKANNVCLTLEKTSKGDKYRLDSEDNNWKNLYNYHYLYNNKDVNKVTLYNKVRTFLSQFSEDKPRKAVVFFPDITGINEEFTQLVTELQAVNLDTVELEKKAPSQKRPTTEVIVTVLENVRSYSSRCGHDSFTIDLNTNVDKWVYVVKESVEQFTEQKRGLADFCSFLKRNSKYKFCFIAESNVKKIEGNTNFITHEKFMEDPFDKLSVNFVQEIINEYKYKAKDKVERFFNMKGLLDKDLTAIINQYKGKEFNHSYHHGNTWDTLKQRCLNDKQVKQSIEQLQKESEILERYPLVNTRYINEENSAEYICYINAKYKANYEK